MPGDAKEGAKTEENWSKKQLNNIQQMHMKHRLDVSEVTSAGRTRRTFWDCEQPGALGGLAGVSELFPLALKCHIPDLASH